MLDYKKIGIVGNGFVGNPIKKTFDFVFEKDLPVYDLIKEKRNVDSIEELCSLSDVIFVCVPTPVDKKNNCYIGFVDGVISEINSRSSEGIKKIVVIKSTVIVGTTEKLNKKYKNISIIFNPEFLTEANSYSDFLYQDRVILGGDISSCELVKKIYEDFFKKVRYSYKMGGEDYPIYLTDSNTAEMVKYFTNAFLATKVSFANQMKMACDGLDLDYSKVMELSKKDSRLGFSHWKVPGHDGHYGYGGHCLPKDVKSLINLLSKKRVNEKFLKSVDSFNDHIRDYKDWEDMVGRAVI